MGAMKRSLKRQLHSFRLDESALEALQEDAKKQNVSVNTLLNQLVLTYCSFDRPMKRFHMVKLLAPACRTFNVQLIVSQ